MSLAQHLVVHPGDCPTYIGRSRLTKILVAPDAGSGIGLSVSSVEMPPGSATEMHTKGETSEIIYVVTGELVVETDGGDRNLAAGDATVLTPGTAHKHVNPNTSVTNKFLVILTPAGAEETFRARNVLEDVTDL